MEGTPDQETLRIAVRRLAESIARHGDLSPGGWELVNSFEAVKAHQRIQESRPPEYRGEVPLSGTAYGHGFQLRVEGRADGVFDYGSSVVLEEIKTTRHSLDDLVLFENPVH